MPAVAPGSITAFCDKIEETSALLPPAGAGEDDRRSMEEASDALPLTFVTCGWIVCAAFLSRIRVPAVTELIHHTINVMIIRLPTAHTRANRREKMPIVLVSP